MLRGARQKAKQPDAAAYLRFTSRARFRYNAFPAERGALRKSSSVPEPRILILTVHHGSAHVRISNALRKALLEIRPGLSVDVVDALAHCTRWFRAYYNSFEIPLKYWPALWGWIESAQHHGESTGPAWLYRRGARPLFRFIEARDPDAVVATEVGLCEIAAMMKRETRATFRLAGVDGLDMDRPWAQPEVDLFPSAPGDVVEQLLAAGVSRDRILACGVPVDPVFGSLQDRAAVRRKLELEEDIPALLVIFGGPGFGKPRQVVREIAKVRHPLQVVFITRRHQRLTEEVQRLCAGRPHTRVLGWVDNLHEWMGAADLLVGRAGGTTVTEALNSGLPILGFDPPPGLEQRVCGLIEKWEVGYWIRKMENLAPCLERLLSHREELQRLRDNALAQARPRVAHDAGNAILNLLKQGTTAERDWDDRRPPQHDGPRQSTGAPG